MRTLKGWQWKKTELSEYKSIEGFVTLGVMHKITFKHKGHDYAFCPRSGSSDYVSLFLYDDHTLYVYSENPAYRYAGVKKYYLKDGVIKPGDFIHFLQSDYDFMGLMQSDNYNCIDRFFDYSNMHKCKLLAAYDQYDDKCILNQM